MVINSFREVHISSQVIFENRGDEKPIFKIRRNFLFCPERCGMHHGVYFQNRVE